jgi:hypothetical protein
MDSVRTVPVIPVVHVTGFMTGDENHTNGGAMVTVAGDGPTLAAASLVFSDVAFCFLLVLICHIRFEPISAILVTRCPSADGQDIGS